ncbi:MAG: hypothetical protein HKN47_02695 [Pirellulaceae bacterium]|nr:hypothetical protein [Pirellulaceae bacterium]
MRQTPECKTQDSLFESEDAHEECLIEWWFFQGHYESAPTNRRHFMATLFRYRFEQYDEPATNCFQLLLTVLNERDQTHHAQTWVDQTARMRAVEKLTESRAQVDTDVQQALIEELRQNGPPDPIQLVDCPEQFIASPFSIVWNGLELKQITEGFHLTFCEPGTGREVSLRMNATQPRLKVSCDPENVPLGDAMDYHCYPRLDVTGQIDSREHITGSAWHDHQWGGSGWFGDVDGLLGWDWFGINLDDGSDLVIMLHREAKSGDVVARHATFRQSLGKTISTHEFALHPLRFWESPDTRIQHPIEWEIQIPDWDARLTFRPLLDDQEVPCFGTMRAIWEGAGTVTGIIAGQPVQGRARGEFYGYGYLFDFQQYLKRVGQEVDRSLEKYLPRRFDESAVERIMGPATWKHEPEAYTEMISRPVWDLIDRSGKRWRPVFGLLMLEALGVDSKPYQDLICNMSELIHTGALIIDDIEDQSELRRGQPCVHLRYGVDVALNAGNLLYFLPALSLLEHPKLTPEVRLRLHAIRERTMMSAHGGQNVDIYWSRKMNSDRLAQWLRDDLDDRILQMYAMKTGAGVMGLAEFAAVIADADSQTTTACIDFARDFAVAFQIVDDVHNFSTSKRWTKVCGEDLANGKLTFVVAKALRMLDAERSGRLRNILCCEQSRSDPANVRDGTELIRESGALETCRETAGSLSQQGWCKFSQRARSSEAKIMLHAMSRKLLDLSFDT